jgi:hypothetical protein
VYNDGGRAVAQAVSLWLPTAAAPGSNPGLVMWDFVMDKVALGQVFSEYFWFNLLIFIPPNFSTITSTYHPGLVQ